MTTRQGKKLVQVGRFVAAVDVVYHDDETSWSPTLSLEDARKLDRIRRLLSESDLLAVSKEATVFEQRNPSDLSRAG
ncbi:MAG: hypothetical protein QM770_14955 [Tepidisphaeraceae bacterium]